MSDQDNNKDLRRQKFADKNHKNHKNHQISDEQRFISKSKKQFKKNIEEIRGEELWEDWENEIR
jgi:hypothetical protein